MNLILWSVYFFIQFNFKSKHYLKRSIHLLTGYEGNDCLLDPKIQLLPKTECRGQHLYMEVQQILPDYQLTTVLWYYLLQMHV